MITQEITDPDELRSLGGLRERIAEIPAVLSDWERIAQVEQKPRSELALDDSVTSWWQLSHSLTQHLNHAADALRTLTVLIPAEGELAIPYMSHFAVARSGLEAAALALWIVSPEDPRERISRHLANGWREANEESSFVNAILDAMAKDATLGSPSEVDRGRKEHKAWRKKRVDHLRTVANRVGLEDPTRSSWNVGFAEIVREASQAIDLPGIYGEAIWRELSGLSHPSTIRAVRSMSVEEKTDYGDGTLGVILTSDVAKIRYSIEATHVIFRQAVRASGARKIRVGDATRYRRVAPPLP